MGKQRPILTSLLPHLRIALSSAQGLVDYFVPFLPMGRQEVLLFASRVIEVRDGEYGYADRRRLDVRFSFSYTCTSSIIAVHHPLCFLGAYGQGAAADRVPYGRLTTAAKLGKEHLQASPGRRLSLNWLPTL